MAMPVVIGKGHPDPSPMPPKSPSPPRLYRQRSLTLQNKPRKILKPTRSWKRAPSRQVRSSLCSCDLVVRSLSSVRHGYQPGSTLKARRRIMSFLRNLRAVGLLVSISRIKLRVVMETSLLERKRAVSRNDTWRSIPPPSSFT